MSATASFRASAPTVDGSRSPRPRRSRRFAGDDEQPVTIEPRETGPAGLSARRDRWSHDTRHAGAESRHSQRQQLASRNQRRRPPRGVRVGSRRTSSVATTTAPPTSFSTIVKPGPSRWVSRAADGQSAGGESTSPVISVTAVSSPSSRTPANLVCTRRRLHASPAIDDINLVWDVFLLDREPAASFGPARTSSAAGWSGAPRRRSTATGQVLAFSSRHPVDRRPISRRLRSVRPRLTPPPVRAVTRKVRVKQTHVPACFLPIFDAHGWAQPRTRAARRHLESNYSLHPIEHRGIGTPKPVAVHARAGDYSSDGPTDNSGRRSSCARPSPEPADRAAAPTRPRSTSSCCCSRARSSSFTPIRRPARSARPPSTRVSARWWRSTGASSSSSA